MGRSKKSEAKRASIRHAAYVCFREKGYHETSIDEICETAKISKGSFYWHYGAKIDVFGDILESWARQVVDELLDQFDAIPDEPAPITTLIEVADQGIPPRSCYCAAVGRIHPPCPARPRGAGLLDQILPPLPAARSSRSSGALPATSSLSLNSRAPPP